MPKYKMRLCPPGDYLYCEGETVYVGNTADDALTFYIEEEYEEGPEVWVHPEILRGRIVYARDVENMDCHEDAEPGDTTYDLVTSDPEGALRELRGSEVRSWPRGTWRPHWSYRPKNWVEPTYEATVAGESIGEFEDRDAAQKAVDVKCAELIDVWKAAHPEYRREVPTSDD